jgi:hypothetical protein
MICLFRIEIEKLKSDLSFVIWAGNRPSLRQSSIMVLIPVPASSHSPIWRNILTIKGLRIEWCRDSSRASTLE